METRKVLVTGCSGFLGRYVIDEFVNAGHEVTGFDIALPSFPLASFVQGDFTSKESIGHAVGGKEIVCHLGGVGDVYLADKDPGLAFRANAVGTKILCDACGESYVDRLVYASTWEVYGKPIADPIVETHPCNPESPYSISKLAGELFVRKANDAGRMRTLALRLGTAYGSGMRQTAVIARFIEQALEGKALSIYGDGSQFRQFTHALDIGKAFVNASTIPAAGGVYNIASDERVTVAELAREIAKHYGVAIEVNEPRAGEPPSAHVSSKKARFGLHWQESINFAEGLQKVIADVSSSRST